jgi:hypothetical protein
MLGMVVAGCLVMDAWRGGAIGQTPAGFEHAFGRKTASELPDEGRGVAVLRDGGVMAASHIWRVFGDDVLNVTGLSMTDLVRHNADGTEAWTAQFLPDDESGFCVPRALTLADPTITGDPLSENPPNVIGYVAGRYKGRVDFLRPGTPTPIADSGGRVRSYVVAFGDPAGTPPKPTRAFIEFQGTGENGAMALAAGSDALRCVAKTPNSLTRIGDRRVAVGGFFTGELRVPLQGGDLVLNADGGDDGYVILLDGATLTPPPTGLKLWITIGGSGNQRVTAVAVEPRSGDLLVAGWCEGPTDFDPDPNRTAGGTFATREMFLARYTDAFPESYPTLKWYRTFGGAGADEASGVGVSVDQSPTTHDLIVLAGTWGDAPGVPGGPAITALRDPVGSGTGPEISWQAVLPGYADDRCHALSIDGLGRIVIAGRFGCPITEPPTSCESPYPLDFNPRPDQQLLLTPQRSDGFIARFHPWPAMVAGAPYGQLEWAWRIGAGNDEAIWAVAADPASTSRIALAGFFGGPDAAAGYQIDTDPGPGQNLLTAFRGPDAFTAAIQPVVPAVRSQISVVLDNSCGTTASEWSSRLASLADRIVNTDAGGHTPPLLVPKDGTVQVNVLAYSVPKVEGFFAAPLMPWTTLDSQATAELFAARLRTLPLLYWTQDGGSGLAGSRFSEGLRAAALLQPRSRAPASVNSGVLMIAETTGETNQVIGDARDEALAAFDRTCVLIPQISTPVPPGRQWVRSTLVSIAVGPVLAGAGPLDARTVGFAGDVQPSPPPGYSFDEQLQRMLTRLSFCPGDYNGDGCVSRAVVPVNDQGLFTGALGPPALTTYADWNFDQLFDSLDGNKFGLGVNALPFGVASCAPANPCPPPQVNP